MKSTFLRPFPFSSPSSQTHPAWTFLTGSPTLRGWRPSVEISEFCKVQKVCVKKSWVALGEYPWVSPTWNNSILKFVLRTARGRLPRFGHMLQVECGWLQIKRKQQSSVSGWNEPHPVSKIHNHTGQLQDGPLLGINEVIAPINGL